MEKEQILKYKKTVTKRGPIVIIPARKQAPEIVRLINLFDLNVTFTMGRLLKTKKCSREGVLIKKRWALIGSRAPATSNHFGNSLFMSYVRYNCVLFDFNTKTMLYMHILLFSSCFVFKSYETIIITTMEYINSCLTFLQDIRNHQLLFLAGTSASLFTLTISDPKWTLFFHSRISVTLYKRTETQIGALTRHALSSFESFCPYSTLNTYLKLPCFQAPLGFVEL